MQLKNKTSKKKNLTVYQRIMRAAKKGKGLKLSSEEVSALQRDDAIETRAAADDGNPYYL